LIARTLTIIGPAIWHGRKTMKIKDQVKLLYIPYLVHV